MRATHWTCGTCLNHKIVTRRVKKCPACGGTIAEYGPEVIFPKRWWQFWR